MKKSDNRLLKRVIATALATVNRVIEANAIGMPVLLTLRPIGILAVTG